MRNNPYLVTTSGRLLSAESRPFLFAAPAIAIAVPVLAFLAVGVHAGGGLEAAACLVLLFAVGITIRVMRLWSRRGTKYAIAAASAWDAGCVDIAFANAQEVLSLAVRADIRMRALHVLGLVAEARGHFQDAEDLFRAAHAAIPMWMPIPRATHARVVTTAHRALALAAMGHFAEADTSSNLAWSYVGRVERRYPPTDALVLASRPFAALGQVFDGTRRAQRDLEIARDPLALVALASAVVLVATNRATQALDVIQRHRAVLAQGLWPREQALLAAVELRARTMHEPFRAPSMLPGQEATWAASVLRAA